MKAFHVSSSRLPPFYLIIPVFFAGVLGWLIYYGVTHPVHKPGLAVSATTKKKKIKHDKKQPDVCVEIYFGDQMVVEHSPTIKTTRSEPRKNKQKLDIKVAVNSNKQPKQPARFSYSVLSGAEMEEMYQSMKVYCEWLEYEFIGYDPISKETRNLLLKQMGYDIKDTMDYAVLLYKKQKTEEGFPNLFAPKEPNEIKNVEIFLYIKHQSDDAYSMSGDYMFPVGTAAKQADGQWLTDIRYNLPKHYKDSIKQSLFLGSQCPWRE